MTLILVRYGEIGVKSPPVKRRFEQRLQENIQEKLWSEQVDGTVLKENNRLFVRVTDDQVETAVAALTYVPGIVSLSPVEKTSNSFEDIFDACKPFIDAAADVDSFGLRTRRVGEHEFSSEDVAEDVGQMIVDAYDLDVDLDDPDLEIFIEVRHGDAYMYTENIDGVGGLPVNEEYRVLARLETRADVVAAHLLQRRGCTIIPHTTEDREQAQEFVGLLHGYDPNVKLVTAPDQSVEDLVDVFDCQAYCKGTTVEDVETERQEDVDVLVLEPCCGMDQEEIETRFYDL